MGKCQSSHTSESRRITYICHHLILIKSIFFVYIVDCLILSYCNWELFFTAQLFSSICLEIVAGDLCSEMFCVQGLEIFCAIHNLEQEIAQRSSRARIGQIFKILTWSIYKEQKIEIQNSKMSLYKNKNFSLLVLQLLFVLKRNQVCLFSTVNKLYRFYDIISNFCIIFPYD